MPFDNSLEASTSRAESLFFSLAFLPTTLGKESMVEFFLSMAVKEFNADFGRVLLRQSDGNYVVFNSDEDFFLRNRVDAQISEQILIDTELNSRGLQIDSINSLKGSFDESVLERSTIDSLLSAPLFSGRWVLGSIYLARSSGAQAFRINDLNLFLAFANIFAREMDRFFSGNALLNLAPPEQIERSTSATNFTLKTEVKAFVGHSSALNNALKEASFNIGNDFPLLILGETGVGKKLLANLIHSKSTRSNKPLLILKNETFNDELTKEALQKILIVTDNGITFDFLEEHFAEIFAMEGTLIIDRIDLIDKNIEPLLEKFIHENEDYTKYASIPLLRIIATAESKSHLSKGIEQLFDRTVISLPKLTEMLDDMPVLIEHFQRKYGWSRSKLEFSEDVLRMFLIYEWPGNIRELENLILHFVLNAKLSRIEISDLPLYLLKSGLFSMSINRRTSLSEAENEFRKYYISRMMSETGSKTELAEMLCINRTHLYKLLSQFGL